jgi:hypothetical protein
LQWLQALNEINGDNFNNIRHESSRHFMNKDLINELAINSEKRNVKTPAAFGI